MKKIPKVHLERLIYVPWYDQLKDWPFCQETSWERSLTEERSTKILQPIIFHLPSPKNADSKTNQVKPFLLPSSAWSWWSQKHRQQEEEGKKENTVGEGEEAGHVPPPRAGSGLQQTSPGEGKKLWLKTKLFYYYTHLDIPMIEMRLFGRLKWPEIFCRGSRITSPTGWIWRKGKQN